MYSLCAQLITSIWSWRLHRSSRGCWICFLGKCTGFTVLSRVTGEWGEWVERGRGRAWGRGRQIHSSNCGESEGRNSKKHTEKMCFFFSVICTDISQIDAEPWSRGEPTRVLCAHIGYCCFDISLRIMNLNHRSRLSLELTESSTPLDSMQIQPPEGIDYPCICAHSNPTRESERVVNQRDQVHAYIPLPPPWSASGWVILEIAVMVSCLSRLHCIMHSLPNHDHFFFIICLSFTAK